MKDFISGASGLTKNPLGVIGLFVCLVYGLACAVLLINGRDLKCGESWALVTFVVLFPCVILAVFYQLVTKHHGKLYAPSDYKDERNFLSPMALSKERISERLDLEVESFRGSQKPIEGKDEGLRDKAIAPPINEHLGARAEYGNSERLAFMALEKKIGKPFRKYVGFDVAGMKIEFDGYLEDKNEVHLIEVAVLSKATVLDHVELREKIVSLINRAKLLWGDNFVYGRTFWIAFVYDFPKEELRAALRGSSAGVNLHEHRGFNLNIHYLNLGELKETYG